MESRVSRRSALLSVVGGVAGLAVVPTRIFAAQVQQPGATARPTVAWIDTGAHSDGLNALWVTGPDRLQVEGALRPQHNRDRVIMVSPDRVVQLRDGTMLSLVVWQQSDARAYGVVDLRRVAREGWIEQRMAVGSGVTPYQLVTRAIAVLEGQPTAFSILAQPAIPVRQR